MVVSWAFELTPQGLKRDEDDTVSSTGVFAQAEWKFAERWALDRQFNPRMGEATRKRKLKGWREAVNLVEPCRCVIFCWSRASAAPDAASGAAREGPQED